MNQKQPATMGVVLPSAQEDSGDRLRKLQIMLAGRYHYAAILVILGIIVGGFGAYKFVKPVYQSEGSVQVEQFSSTALPGTEEQLIRNLESYILAQIEMLTGGEIITDAMRSEKWRATGEDMNPVDFAQAITTEYTTRRNRNQEIFRVMFTHENPHTAQAGLEALLTAYEQWHARQDSERKMQLLRVLERMRAEAMHDIDNLTQQIFRIAPAGLERIDHDRAVTLEQLELVSQELDAARAQLELARHSANEQQEVNPATIDAIIGLIADSGDRTMQMLMDNLRRAETELHYVEERAGPNHWQAKQLRAAYNVARQNVENYARQFDLQRIPNAVQSLTAQELESRITQLTARYNELDARINDLARLRLNVQQLDRRRSLADDQLVRIIARIDSEMTSSTIDEKRVRVLGRGTIPTLPYNASQRKQVAVIGGAFGGAAGFGLMLLIGAMDRRLRDSEDVKWTTGNAGLLGVLPALPQDLADPEQAAIASHCVHHIRALLQVTNEDEEPGRVFSVTSPAAGTGKTSLTLALGLSFAECGARTLLIDADLFGGQLSARVNAIVRRRIGKILKQEGKISDEDLKRAIEHAARTRRKLGVSLVELDLLSEHDVIKALDAQSDTRVGLLDALEGEPLRECVAQTGFHNLFILPIGQAQPYDAGRLAPKLIRRLFHEALKEYDIVLVDTGPIPASLEASVVASESDGVILTVSRGEQRPLAAKAKQHLESIGAHVAGVVFNRAEGREVSTYSYRPRSISGERVPRSSRRTTGKVTMPVDQRTVTYGPIAQAVSLSASPQRGTPYRNSYYEHESSNGNGRSRP